MMPDRCQTPEVPILQTSKCPLPPTPQRLRSRHITGKRTVKSGKNVADPGMKLVTSRRSTDPMIYRARLMPRLEIRPSGRTPGVSFICTKGGRVEQDQDPHTNHSRNFRLEDPPQFFGQIFLGKNFGNKNRVVSIPEERVLSVVPF